MKIKGALTTVQHAYEEREIGAPKTESFSVELSKCALRIVRCFP